MVELFSTETITTLGVISLLLAMMVYAKRKSSLAYLPAGSQRNLGESQFAKSISHVLQASPDYSDAVKTMEERVLTRRSESDDTAKKFLKRAAKDRRKGAIGLPKFRELLKQYTRIMGYDRERLKQAE